MFRPMQIPVVFNVTGRPAEPGKTVAQYLEQQIISPVRMVDTIRYLAQQGVDEIIEIGPGSAVSGFVKKTAPGIRTVSIDRAEDLRAVLGGAQG